MLSTQWAFGVLQAHATERLTEIDDVVIEPEEQVVIEPPAAVYPVLFEVQRFGQLV
jgi:hypothetical protein